MASGKQLMEQIYDQFLVCKICFEIYKRPKTLICLHTFCVDCLIKHQDAEFERTYRYSIYNATVSCPICRKKTDLPTGGVRRLPDNFLVANLADVVTRRRPYAKYQECEICKADKYNVQRQAVSKCLDCAKLLCKLCVELHHQTKVTKSHSLFDIEIEKEIECKDHPDEIVRFYCEPCEQCICVVCTFQEHKGHDVSSFSEGMQKYQASLDKLVSLCRERIYHVKEQIGIISKCEVEIKNAEDQIRDMAIDSITDIRKKEREMVQNVYDAFGTEALDFLKEKQPLQENLETLQNTCNLTDVVTRDKSVELLLLKDEIQQKINKLLEREMEVPPASLSKQVKFIPGSVHFGQLSVDGEVCNGDTNNSLPSIQIKIATDNADCQTDQVSYVDQDTTTDQPVCEIQENKLTQTSAAQVEERGTSPICAPSAKVRSRGSMTDASRIKMHEKQTNTQGAATAKRKTQTDQIQTAEQGMETYMSCLNVTNKSTNTKLYETCERSTLTKQREQCHVTTDTLGLVVCNVGGSLTPLCYVTTSSTSSSTDPAETMNVAAIVDSKNTAAGETLVDGDVGTKRLPTMELGKPSKSQFIAGSVCATPVDTCSTGSADSDVWSRDKSVDTSPLALHHIPGTGGSSDSQSDTTEPAVKKARLDNTLSQTEIQLHDMDHLWQILNRKMSNTATNTDHSVIVKPRVASMERGIVTDPIHNVPLKCGVMRDNSTTMNSNVLTILGRKARRVTFSGVSEQENEDQQTAMEVDDSAKTLVQAADSSTLVHVTHGSDVGRMPVRYTDDRPAIEKKNGGVIFCTIKCGPDEILTAHASTSTNHNVHACDQITNTVTKSYSEKMCGSTAPEMKDKKTITFIERRNVAIMKRPHYISRGVITPKVSTSEQITITDPKETVDAITFTDVTPMVDTGCDPVLHLVKAKCVGTERVSYQHSATSPYVISKVERASSPILLPVMTHRESSPIKISVSSKATNASPICEEIGVETMSPSTRDTFTMMPVIKHVHRKTSPVRDFKSSVSQSTSTRHVTYATRALSPIRGLGRAKGTMTSQPTAVHRGSSPVRIRGHDKVTMVSPTVQSQQTETVPKRTSDVCVSTLKINVVNKGTEMVRKHYIEKQTLTTRIHCFNKMVGTETTKCVDGYTTMTSDIASTYKDVITPKPVQTCSRGTSTKVVDFVTKETSPDRPYSSDRGSSPVKFATFDKGITANKAQLLEPRDTFQSVGMITMPFRPVADNPKSELESIEEMTESDEEYATKESQTETPPRSPRPTFGRRAMSDNDLRLSMDAFPRSQTTSVTSRLKNPFQEKTTHRESFMFTAPRLGHTKTPSESMFSFHSTAKPVLPQTEILCKVEMATNTCEKDVESKETSTPPIETEDKCVCTESLQVGSGKMAECISKLKTVRQRLEQQPLYVQAPITSSQTRCPVIAKAPASEDSSKEPARKDSLKTASTESVHEPARKDSLKTASTESAGGEEFRGDETQKNTQADYPKAFLADRVNTTLLIRSKSVEKVVESAPVAPFLTPQLSRKALYTESSDDTDKDDSSGKRSSLARKKRPPIEQLLGRSASLPEQDSPSKPAPKSHSKSFNSSFKPTLVQSEQSLKNLGTQKPPKASSVAHAKPNMEEAQEKRSTRPRRSFLPSQEGKQTIPKPAKEMKRRKEVGKKEPMSKHFLETTVASRTAAMSRAVTSKYSPGTRGRGLLRAEVVKDIETSSESSN